jgi:proline dehydrogenase
VDAEQQVYQPTIDRWTVDVMRRYNGAENAVVLNTYQAYLKCTRNVLKHHLELAGREGWTLGIKLVRGAYLGDETRSLIHDTKAETDTSYNGIARDLLNHSFDDIDQSIFPPIKLFLAGHNADSIRRASTLYKELCLQGRDVGTLEFGQLYGMADHIGGELLAENTTLQDPSNASIQERKISHSVTPQVYKCVNWGSVRECLHFLMRRATENQGAADRLRDGVKESKRELKARLLRRHA